MHPVAGIAGAAVLPGRRGQLGVIPDGDVQHVADADAVLIVLQPLIQRRIRPGDRFYAPHFLQQHRRHAVNLHLVIQIEIVILLHDDGFSAGR